MPEKGYAGLERECSIYPDHVLNKLATLKESTEKEQTEKKSPTPEVVELSFIQRILQLIYKYIKPYI